MSLREAPLSASDDALERWTRRWIDVVVTGKNLCPFSAPVRGTPSRVVVTRDAPGSPQLAGAIHAELLALHATDRARPATTFVLLAHAELASFEAYMEAVAPLAQSLASELTDGAIQVVLFHPHAAWGDGDESLRDAADFSTRSPVPMLHLLRDSDVVGAEAAWVRQHADAAEVPDIQQANAAWLRGIGYEEAERLWRACWDEDARKADV